MALFPQGLSNVDARCNAGERRVLHQLKRCLEDDYIVWHDVPIGPRARQPDFVVLSPRWGVLLLEVKDWRRASLGPGTRDAIELSTARGKVTTAHPLRQARDVVMELADLMQRDPALVHSSGPFAGRLLFPYGWGVVLSGLRQTEVLGSDFAALFPAARTLLRDDLAPEVEPAHFQNRLWGMFTVSYPHTLSLPQRDRIRWHLFPEVRLSTQFSLGLDEPKPGDAVAASPLNAGAVATTAWAAEPTTAATATTATTATPATAANARSAATATSSATSALPQLMQVMDLQQEQVARTLGEGHRVIHGAAGSGKTMILIFRAQFLAAAARADRPILVMCFNRTLASRIEAQLRARGVDERVQVRTFHSWCQDMVRSYQLDTPPGLRGNAYFEALAQVLERAVETGRVPAGQYTALLIDEAHDFEDAWLRLAARLVTPQTQSLLVLYDDAQSIYQKQRRKFNFASVGIDARGRTSVLKLNYRNTAEVLALAMQCAHSLLHGDGSLRGDEDLPLVEPTSAGRRGPLPVLMLAQHEREEAQLIVQRMQQAHQEGLPWQDMAVLFRTRAQMPALEQALRLAQVPVQSMNAVAFKRFDWLHASVKLITLHSAKGLEFAWVCVAGLQAQPLREEPLDDALRLLYVAMTRATQQLLLSASGDSAVVRRVQLALQQVGQRFAQSTDNT